MRLQRLLRQSFWRPTMLDGNGQSGSDMEQQNQAGRAPAHLSIKSYEPWGLAALKSSSQNRHLCSAGRVVACTGARNSD